MTTFELQDGEGTAVEIGIDECDTVLIVHEDELIKMIQLAFDAPWFTLNNLLDALEENDPAV